VERRLAASLPSVSTALSLLAAFSAAPLRCESREGSPSLSFGTDLGALESRAGRLQLPGMAGRLLLRGAHSDRARATVSQYTHLCAAGHDIDHPDMPLLALPICIGPDAWVGAGAFIGPGVTIGEGAVVGARSSVFRQVEPWTVVAGNPARFLRERRVRKRRSESGRPGPETNSPGDWQKRHEAEAPPTRPGRGRVTKP
jgi:hypothetical protein